MGAVQRDFPLFPLGVVALPTEYVPLHIFEERYKTMIGECLDGESEFGLDAKQGLLELRSENARLRLVDRLFRAASKRLDLIERAQERARSNGKVRFG